MKRATELLRKTINKLAKLFKIHKKLILLFIILLTIAIAFVAVSRLIFKSQLSSLDDTLVEMKQVLNDSESTTLTSTQSIYIEENIANININYPQKLAKVAYPLSKEQKNNIDSLYNQTALTKLSIQTLNDLSDIRSIATNVPTKDVLADNPQEFINDYNEAIDRLTKYQEVLDLNIVINILNSIRDSAELYVSNNRYDVFEARYDNVYSELEKELENALSDVKQNAISQIESLQNLIARF